MQPLFLIIISLNRKCDCLRLFVSVLCESGRASSLCSSQFPFVGLQEEVEKTLEFKARNSDIGECVRKSTSSSDEDGTGKFVPNYYQILYSYSIFKGNYRSGTEYKKERRK